MVSFTDIIEEVEAHLFDPIDLEALARKMHVSVYEFRRIFSFLTQMPLGEYIRKRRLSLAAIEMYHSKKSIAYFVNKCGYNNASAFSRAFKEFHEITPSEVLGGNSNFKLLTKISAEIVVTGCSDVEYKILSDGDFYVSGVAAQSEMTDTECCEAAWNTFYGDPIAEEISQNNEKIYAVYESQNHLVQCWIGERSEKYAAKRYIPAAQWVCFSIRGTDDATVNRFYNRIAVQFFASTGYEREESLPNIEIYPSDMSGDDFMWEIRIPIKRSLS